MTLVLRESLVTLDCFTAREVGCTQKNIILLAWYNKQKQIGIETTNVPSSILSDCDISTVLLPAASNALTAASSSDVTLVLGESTVTLDCFTARAVGYTQKT
jgi:hypothetical protein